LEWKRFDGKPFSSRIQTLSHVGGVPAINLIIERTEYEDFGMYICTATNSVASTTQVVNIIEGKENEIKNKFRI
jgi:hypothetical protein